MPKYVIERELPGARNMSPQDLQAVSQKSCTVLQNLGPFNRFTPMLPETRFTAFIAPSEIRAHAQQGGFPPTASQRLSR
jgi:hypothetical protein